MKVGVIGTGNMGKAIIDRILYNNTEVVASDMKEKEYKGIKITKENKSVAEKSDIIILAVKPQSMNETIEDIKGVSDGKLIISIAAGLRIGFFESRLTNARVLRVMPTLAIKKGEGVIAYKFGKFCTDKDRKTAKLVLSYFGTPVEVDDEKILDVITGISGSGIAYFIKIIDVFVKSAESNGIKKEKAKQIVYETVRGALALMEDNEHSEEIISKIASKGGTTEQGLAEFDEKGLDGILKSVIGKTIEKCRKLGNENE